MANCTPFSPAMAERCNNSTPIKRVPLCSPVRHHHSDDVVQRTPLSQIHRFVHSGVQLLANTPGKSLHTPEYVSASQLMKDGRTHFLSPLSVNGSIQVGMPCTTSVSWYCHWLKGNYHENHTLKDEITMCPCSLVADNTHVACTKMK